MTIFLRELKRSFLALLVLSALTGLIYPYAITGIARLAFARRAEGSMLVSNGKPVGSALIGQPFNDPKYFWGRLSATDPAFNAANSSGSNLGPLNPALAQTAQTRIDALRKADPTNKESVPVDLVTASASGLDPHVSLAAAYYQARRVARWRRLKEESVRQLIAAKTQHRFLGIIGEPAVNVLELNLALDALKQ